MSTNSQNAREHYFGLFAKMILIRKFEEEIQSLFQKGIIPGTTHLCIGQEAIPVGVTSVLGPADLVAGTYRGHGLSLAIGVEPQELMDEMLGRATGVCGGRSGSMNVIDIKNRLIGCFGIIGGSIGAATGAGISLKRSNGVAVAFFGEGAINQGYFSECLNFAMVRKLPVVYICENNLYGEYTPWEDVTAGQIISRTEALTIPSMRVDGNDVLAVRAAAQDAISQARSGAGPVFIEALTYRFVGHSRSDPGKYRKPGELNSWKLRDPLKITADLLINEYQVSMEEIETLKDAIQKQVDEISRKGQSAPFPDVLTIAREFKEATNG
jgi:TPP-dependent pyruvate/acetoin dehydrogenase alpha subunit